jgi:hypothetical protein
MKTLHEFYTQLSETGLIGLVTDAGTVVSTRIRSEYINGSTGFFITFRDADGVESEVDLDQVHSLEVLDTGEEEEIDKVVFDKDIVETLGGDYSPVRVDGEIVGYSLRIECPKHW